MKVSFGRIIIRSENRNNALYQNQRWVMDRITDAFGYSDKEFAYGKDEMSGKELTLEQFLGRKKGVDIVATAKKDGSVNVKLMKNLKDKNGEVVVSIPVRNQYKQVLTADFNTKHIVDPITNLPKLVAKFKNRCIHWIMHK